MRADAVLLLAVMLGGTIVPLRAHAYCRTTTCCREAVCKDSEACVYDPETLCATNGTALAWGERCVTLWLPNTPAPLPGIDAATLTRVTEDAFAHWQDVVCKSGRPTIDVRLGGAVECALAGFDQGAMQNVNSVEVVSDNWPHSDPLGQLALTTVRSLVSTGEIVDTDIELNAANFQFTASDEFVLTDLESTLTHEAGHALGLDHTTDPEATMNGVWSPLKRTSLRTLEADDEAGICAIYPAGLAASNACVRAAATADPESVCRAIVTPRTTDASGASSCGVAAPAASGERSWIWAVLTIGAVGVSRRRRRAFA